VGISCSGVHPASPWLRKAHMTLDPTAASDAVLAIATARGDRSALGEIYRRHGGPVFRLAQRILNDDRLAEEAVQDVFVTFWQDPSRFDPEKGQLRSYLLMKGHSRAVDALRSEWSRRNRDHRDALDASRPAYDLEREVIDLDLAERVGKALNELGEDERRAITLAFFGGHTYREVADLLGQPEGTVKSRIRTGLKAMRRHLGDSEIDTIDRPGSNTAIRRPEAGPESGMGSGFSTSRVISSAFEVLR
jgi:RNA polymerase sigma-70 factor, ECF subfamily